MSVYRKREQFGNQNWKIFQTFNYMLRHFSSIHFHFVCIGERRVTSEEKTAYPQRICII